MHGNYQNRQNHQKDSTVPVPETVSVENVAAEMPVTEPAVEEVKAPEKKECLGTVTGCSSLLIREKPDKDASIVAAVAAGSELMVDRENSANGFYKVYNAAGIEGYCMKQYVNLKA